VRLRPTRTAFEGHFGPGRPRSRARGQLRPVFGPICSRVPTSRPTRLSASCGKLSRIGKAGQGDGG